MFVKREGVPETIAGLVKQNTGMNTETLMKDTKKYRIDGLSKARDMIQAAMREKRHIYIFGDYDVDGICCGAVMMVGLRALGYEDHVTVRLPKRFSEGYGVSEKAIDEFEGNSLLITVDNGISATGPIKKAKDKGMTVMVVDHHLSTTDENGVPVYPDADLIIDPNAIEGSADFNGYCGAGLAYRIMCQLINDRKVLIRLLCLAAVATIADSVPLTYENRRIVRYGLHYMTDMGYATTGLFALLSLCDYNEYVSETDIGFKIAPCLNAPGRLYDDGAKQSFLLMSFEGGLKEAKLMAEKQLTDNEKRKELSDEWTKKINEQIQKEHLEADNPMTIYAPGVPEGIIGIIAGRIAEERHTPCILLGDAEQAGVLKGSARSSGGVHLYNLLKTGEPYLLRFGGHAPAAGLSLKAENLDAFRQAMQDNLMSLYPDFTREEMPTIYDMELDGRKRNQVLRVFEEVMRYSPYGQGNPAPVLRLKNLAVVPVRTEDGMSNFRYLKNNAGILIHATDYSCISFKEPERYAAIGAPGCIDLVGSVQLHYYKGKFDYRFEFSGLEESSHNQKPEKSGFAKRLEQKARDRTAKRIATA